MHASREFIESYASEIGSALATPCSAELMLFPPAPYLELAKTLLPPQIVVGAQNIYSAPEGAFTGEQSAEMLADLSVSHVLVGHSERRALFGETSADTAAKVAAAQRAGVAAVLCVGETIEERRAGNAQAVVQAQLDAVLEECGMDWLQRGMVAYEPVWAIGTGETATPEQAQEMHEFIRTGLANRDPGLAARVRILYGGSMNPGNAAELLAQPDIDGGLVGGASLAAEKLVAIARAVG